MTWVPPQLTLRHISRTAFGFDPQGHLVNDVDGHALRAIHDAMQQTLKERLKAAQMSDQDVKEGVQTGVKAWLQYLNQSIYESDLFTEAWIKGTMHLYSGEFYYLADSYARQLCGDEKAYLRHLVHNVFPTSFQQAGKSLSLQQVYSSTKSLFQHTLPMDLRVVRESARSVTVQWYATSVLAKVSPDYRTDMIASLRPFVSAMFEQLPVLLKGLPPAKVEERMVEEAVAEWTVAWHEPVQLPRYAMGGALLSVLLVAITVFAHFSPLSYVVLLPLVLGVGWEFFIQQQQQLTQQRKTLLDQIEYNYLQSLELSTTYANLRSANIAHEKQVNDLLAVREAVLDLSTNVDQKRVLDGMIEIMTELLRFDRALVLLRDREKKLLTFGAISHPPNEPADQVRLINLRLDLDEEDPAIGEDALLGVWMIGKSLRVQEPAVYYNSRLNWMLALLEFNNFYSVPLMLGDQLLGVLLVDNFFTRVPISVASRSLVDALATNIAITMENARLYNLQDEQLQKTVRELQILEQIDRELVDTLKLQNVLELVMDWGLRFTGADVATVTLIDDQNNSAKVAAFYGCQAEQLPGGGVDVSFPLEGAGIAGRAARKGKTQVVADVNKDSDFVVVMPNMGSEIAVPVTRRGKVIAVMALESRQLDGFTPEHVAFAERLATRAGVGLENARLYTEAHQERDKLSAILTNTADAVIVVGDGQRVVLLNNAARHVFKLKDSVESFLGKSFYTVFGESPIIKVYDQVYSGVPLKRDTEIALEDKTYHVNAARVEDIGQTLILHDVTPFKDLDRLKNELVSAVSHDLKNPLSVMRGYIDLIEVTQPLTEKGRGYSNRIMISIAGMLDLIDNILDLAKIDSGLQLQRKAFSMSELIVKAEDDLQLNARQKGINLVNDFDSNIPLAFGDETRVKQIAVNLIHNAIKYTLSASDIVVSVKQEGKFLKIAIKDHGVGIPEDVLPTIWERFVRVRDEHTKHIEGTGLGLAIVKSLVEAHNGQVGLESEQSVGSTFWFTLPTATTDQIAQAIETHTSASSGN